MRLKSEVRYDISTLVVYFLLFSIIGWLYEVALAFLYGYGFINRGFLYGPYLPLYGFGSLLMILTLHKVKERRVKIGKLLITPLIVFLLIVAMTTALEYAVGVVLEAIFDKRWWDYSTYSYNFQGLICLSASLRFGAGGMVFVYFLEPLFRKLLSQVPPRHRSKLAILIAAALAVDLALTLYISSCQGFRAELAQPKF